MTKSRQPSRIITIVARRMWRVCAREAHTYCFRNVQGVVHPGPKTVPYNGYPVQLRAPSVSLSLSQRYFVTSKAVQSLEDFKNSIEFPSRTVNVCDVSSTPDVNAEVVIHGYLGVRSDLSKKLSFVPLRDVETDDQIQVVSAVESVPDATHDALRAIKPYEPVAIQGILKAKPVKAGAGPDNGARKGLRRDVELHLSKVQRLNTLSPDVILTEGADYAPDQRCLRLKTDASLREALRLRDNVMRICHQELKDFLFVETPLLFKSTSEGANEFIVPTRRKGFAYALPQSPQQLKQILMAGGISKYYQFAKCFRDEDLRADRQPEFTQLDLEMAFATSRDVIKIMTQLVRRVWAETLSVNLPFVIPTMTYNEAMQQYGIDKPDLRISYQIQSAIQASLPEDFIRNISSITNPAIDMLVLPLEGSPQDVRSFVTSLLDSPEMTRYMQNPSGRPGIMIRDSRQPLGGLSALGFEGSEYVQSLYEELADGHLLVFQARENVPFTGGSTELGTMRLAIHQAAVTQGLLPATPWKEFKPLWVVDFPLFSPANDEEPGQGGRSGLASTHHPFTSPKTAADVDLLLSDPSRALGDHYDLVINGEEIGGGSRRIHNADVQELVFREVLQMEEGKIQQFSPLLNALKAACPPHAGIALGFDRLIAMLHSHRRESSMSIRDVVAFPKTGAGEDPMIGSPARLSSELFERYHLRESN